MPLNNESAIDGPPIGKSIAIALVTLIFFVAIWSLKNTVQTESANMVDACRLAASELKRGADDGAQQ